MKYIYLLFILIYFKFEIHDQLIFSKNDSEKTAIIIKYHLKHFSTYKNPYDKQLKKPDILRTIGIHRYSEKIIILDVDKL